jgi:hypothetical protein
LAFPAPDNIVGLRDSYGEVTLSDRLLKCFERITTGEKDSVRPNGGESSSLKLTRYFVRRI